VCRAAAGECDVAETCTGNSAACPVDGFKAANSACTDDGNVCTRDVCTGTSAACSHPAGNAGTVCRAAAGECDVAETCSGTSPNCPADQLAGAGAVCRAAAAQCEADATCDGASAGCPANPPTPDGSPCDDGKPETATSVCHAQQCEGVSVGVQVPPPVVQVPPTTQPAAVAVPVTLVLPGGGAQGKTDVLIQGFASCSELQPPPAGCTTKLCRKLRTRLTQVCGASVPAVARLVGVPQIDTHLVAVTRKSTRSFAGSRSGSVHLKTPLNSLGALYYRQNGRLPVQGDAQIHDPQGRSIHEFFRTLLQRG